MKRLDVDTASELAWITSGDGFYGMNVLEKKQMGKHRWSTWYQVTFQVDGELWAFDWEEAATESQEVDHPDVVECFPVEAHTVTTYVALPKPKAKVAVPARLKVVKK